MRLHITVFLLMVTLALQAQPKQNSPYSLLGIGDPMPQYFANQAAMGGMTAAFHDPYHLNLKNPASFAFLRATALETGLFAKSSNYTSSAGELNNWSGNLAYLALGFTLKSPINEVLDKKQSPWQAGMGIALTPYSLVGYNVQTNDTLPDLGIVTNSFEGNGGSYRLIWSNAVKYKKTALGLNLGWMFGKATYENTTAFNDSLPTFRNNFRDQISISGLVWDIGFQHDFVLLSMENDKTQPEKWITFGLSFSGNQDIGAISDKIRLRSRGRLDNGTYLTPDTLLYEPNVDFNMTLPGSVTAGLQYVNSTKFKLGLEYTYIMGENYRNEARPGSFRNASAIAAGMEYTPDYSSYNNYTKRIRYRLGAYYREDPRIVEGNGLDDIGISLGAGFPIVLPRQQTSFINTALEIGKLGANTPIEETYYRITLGFTLNDNSWFFKRRFE